MEKLKHHRISVFNYRFLLIGLVVISLALGSIFTLHLAIILDFRVSTDIVGESMHKSITEDSKVLSISDNYKKIKRGNIVHARAYLYGNPLDGETGEPLILIKRVIAMPNETITIKGNQVYINNQLLEEPYAYYSGDIDDNLTVTLEDDQYFLLGDNRLHSGDSRFFDVATSESILGVALLIK